MKTHMQEIVVEMKADRDAHVQEIVAKIDANQNKMEATVHSIRSDRKIQCRIENEVERREVPTEEASVKSSGITKKRHRGRHIAAGRRREPKELTQRDWGSRGKLAAACRKVSRRAAVAWRKRNIFKTIRTRGNGGSRRKSSVAGRKITRCA
jgi:hypothetical protein